MPGPEGFGMDRNRGLPGSIADLFPWRDCHGRCLGRVGLGDPGFSMAPVCSGCVLDQPGQGMVPSKARGNWRRFLSVVPFVPCRSLYLEVGCIASIPGRIPAVSWIALFE